MKRMHMPQVSDSGEPNEHSHNALLHIAFPHALQGRHSRTVISELNMPSGNALGVLRLCTPLLTLPHAITGRRGIARGRSGSLLLSPQRTWRKPLPHLLLHAGFNRRFQDVPKAAPALFQRTVSGFGLDKPALGHTP